MLITRLHGFGIIMIIMIIMMRVMSMLATMLRLIVMIVTVLTSDHLIMMLFSPLGHCYRLVS